MSPKEITMFLGLVVFLYLTSVMAEFGTTSYLKEIVIGRCYDYVILVNPSTRYNCEEIWQEFENSVIHRSPLDVRLLFWSKTRELLKSYAAATGPYWTLEDTLVGFMFNDLIWCGHQMKDRELHAVEQKPFALAACGNITVLLNGSIHQAFNKNSMFGSVELDNLNPRMVNYVHIKVVYNLEGPFV
ncbi:hypothetical protein DNTS_035776 [Danionella cerebrum]|uniref:ADP-ribosyl cyclase/cyclic ADP-ribose hydrolase n=1 Tax=Danionella cerebrum TaxID=2873325 RepID=A0A553QM38_9TELE|nr:hypothetical protein DNTS_035776 [Danionella translucida]